MTERDGGPVFGNEAVLASRLLSAQAVRASAEHIYRAVQDGQSEHFELDEAQLAAVESRLVERIRSHYPNLTSIPPHSRWRHLRTSEVDHAATFLSLLGGKSRREKLVTALDWVITSVLLDAGAGPAWKYRPSGYQHPLSRSEGLAIAHFDWFCRGGLSASPQSDPLRVDAERLETLTESDVMAAFQVDAGNPLVGCEGRTALLKRLGQAVRAGSSAEFAGPGARPGNLLGALLGWEPAEERAGGPAQSPTAQRVLGVLLRAMSSIWPSRISLGGQPLGDVWRHSRFGFVAFHKLVQWLAYSVCDTLETLGQPVTAQESLTGLAEYRNGGLFLDAAVILPKRPELLAEWHRVDSDVVIEWRALTVALLDRVASNLRRHYGVDAATLPLAKVLEAGTWALGRELAAERRVGATPPLQVVSDGTVF